MSYKIGMLLILRTQHLTRVTDGVVVFNSDGEVKITFILNYSTWLRS